VLAGAAVLIALVALVLLLAALKGGGGSGPVHATAAASARQASGAHHAGAGPAAPDTVVTVLNGTSTPGLAHHLAADLQQSGYTRAAASAGVPAGSHTTSVVEYAAGHRAAAERVAKALTITQVRPLDPGTAALVGAAVVVVVAGEDQAALVGGGGSRSHGEPAAGGAPGAGEPTPAA
jgi:hypothetical protein